MPYVAVVGVDPSLAHTGVCVLLDGKVTREYALETGPETGPRPLRLALQRDRLVTIVKSAGDAARALVVAMETEVWGLASGHTASEQSAIQAIYQDALWALSGAGPPLHYLPVNVHHVKKFAGAQLKDQILLAVYKRWGREYKDHNLADAFLIAVIGHAFFCRDLLTNKELVKPQLEVLAGLVKSGGYPWEAPPESKFLAKKKGKK